MHIQNGFKVNIAWYVPIFFCLKMWTSTKPGFILFRSTLLLTIVRSHWVEHLYALNSCSTERGCTSMYSVYQQHTSIVNSNGTICVLRACRNACWVVAISVDFYVHVQCICADSLLLHIITCCKLSCIKAQCVYDGISMLCTLVGMISPLPLLSRPAASVTWLSLLTRSIALAEKYFGVTLL